MPERLWFMCRSHQDFGIDSSATSLSAAALDRFVRPVTYQSLRDERLALQAEPLEPSVASMGCRNARVDAMSPAGA